MFVWPLVFSRSLATLDAELFLLLSVNRFFQHAYAYKRLPRFYSGLTHVTRPGQAPPLNERSCPQKQDSTAPFQIGQVRSDHGRPNQVRMMDRWNLWRDRRISLKVTSASNKRNSKKKATGTLIERFTSGSSHPSPLLFYKSKHF